ncbi:hypothetical protein AMJ39_03740 [candidate division TA06 bacterium DG_24]|jgi:nitrogen regulatory protein P-II 1|uniref:Uncharacterized protein n=2 Tax=Bacteria division TA06 TaxID=1156500 RepID=A0A0S8G4H6_UNCT6|nr:MAG: hypothetical protein AMJ39_03740 [candidate division TA06 bacterium DG_24]KPK67927.1 MAG: hypothetical protein AMJ82_09530 [candidate division TA06 bacterium SM23_40]
MHLLVIVLGREEHLDEVLTILIEHGVTGGTVIETVGMGRIVAHEIPVFTGLRHLIDVGRPYNKTIFSVIEDASIFDHLIEQIERICGSFDDPGTGIAFMVSVGKAKGIVPQR